MTINQSESPNSLQITTTTSRHSSILTLLWFWIWHVSLILTLNVHQLLHVHQLWPASILPKPSSNSRSLWIGMLWCAMRPSDIQKLLLSLPSLHVSCNNVIAFVLCGFFAAISKCFSSWLWNRMSYFQIQILPLHFLKWQLIRSENVHWSLLDQCCSSAPPHDSTFQFGSWNTTNKSKSWFIFQHFLKNMIFTVIKPTEFKHSICITNIAKINLFD